MKKSVVVLAFPVAVLLAAGCIVRGHAGLHIPPPPTASITVGAHAGPPPPAVVHATIAVPRPVMAANVQVIQRACTPGAPEVLNGIDDNCNGLIDEGWVQGGNLQITLGWSSGADLDLYVVDPGGEEIYYGNDSSASGGALDRDARGACTDGQTGENVYWSGSPPGGHYIVRVNYFESSSCNVGPTAFVVSVSFNGEIIGAYQYTIGFGETVDVLQFDL